MADIPQRLTKEEAEVVAAWIEKQKGSKVILDRYTAMKVAATLRAGS